VTTPDTKFPLPPDPLLLRVGANPESRDRAREVWQQVGQRCHGAVLSLIPDDWSFDGKTVLDFGCGAGRVLRHFDAEAERTEAFSGCDVHPASIEWLDEHLCPPFQVFRNDADPPLPLADASVDLVYAFSVFSHLTTTASAWLLELRRILRPDGILLVTFQGPGFWELRGDASELPELDTVGRTVWGQGKGFCEGTGPDSFMAAWWVREHWGRAFHIDEIAEIGIPLPPIPEIHGRGQGYVVMRSNGRPCTVEEIEAPNPSDEREVAGLLVDRSLMLEEMGDLRYQLRKAEAELDATHTSRSWRLTAPLRAVRRRLVR
jgi:SAM-dependent methyltransferase